MLSLQGDRYKLISPLAEGGFGQIYVAEDTHRPGNPKCIVKHLRPTSQDLTFLQVARRLFNSEAKTLEKLGRHEQIPQLLAYFEENQEFYLVQEYIEGHSLSEELAHGQKLSEVEAIALLQDVLSILEFVHQQGVIHRDIKPSNLIRRQADGKLVLIDFGAVKEIHTQLAIGDRQTSLTVAIGTQGYMPNEQSAGKPRFNSDIYALGIIAIQALTGLKSSQLGEDPNTFEIIWRNQAQVSAQLAKIIDLMVRYDFRQRYQSATEVLQALQKLTDAAISSPRRNWKRLIGNSWKILGVGWIAATSLIFGVLFVIVAFSFTQAGAVIPLASPALALVVTGALVFAGCVFFAKQQPTIRDTNSVQLIPPHHTVSNSAQEDQTLPPVSYLSGSTITTIQGDIAVNEVRRYSLKCNQGQRLTMEVIAGNVNLTVVDPEARTVATTLNQSMKWQGLLTKGEYTIEIAALEQSTYTITVDVLS